MLFRIFTENKNQAQVEYIVSSHFDAFTIFKATGYWKGIPEHSLVIEVSGDDIIEASIRDMCAQIKSHNEQECVLIQKIECSQEFI